MKHLVSCLSLVLLTGLLTAQERVPHDKAQQIAKLLLEATSKEKDADRDLAWRLDGDADKPCAIHKGDYAAMVIPDKKLALKTTPDPRPVAQLWMKNLAPAIDGKVVANEKLHILKVTAEGEEHSLPFFQLALRERRGAKDKDAATERGIPLELIVLAKDKQLLSL